MQDLRLALRQLRMRPGFTAVAVLTLALGIGANTAVFTVVHAVLLRPLPYEDPSRVVVLTEQTPQFPTASVTRYNYDDWRTRSRSFTAMGAARSLSLTVSGSGEPERVAAKMISASLLPLLGVRPLEGAASTTATMRLGLPAWRCWPRASRAGASPPVTPSGANWCSTTRPTPSSAFPPASS